MPSRLVFLACALCLCGACADVPPDTPPPPLAAKPMQASSENGQRPLFQASDLGLLESDDRDRWQRVDDILDDLKISDGSVVADIAAGGGWFSDRLSRRVGPAGLVYAEEIQSSMIQAMTRRFQVENISNIRPVLGTPTDPHLPADGLDAIVIINSFHDIDQPVPLLEHLRAALNRRGLIGVVDFTPGGGGPGPDADERVAPETIIAAAAAANLHLIAQHAVPPFEYLLVFGR
jgi:ubiquinone/menaquinone biosynthesis C-methylase UbiE